jgi:protein-arginine kinase activator protein McsA
MSMVKMCNKCNLEKDIILFQTIKNNKDGLSYSCKACLKEYTSSWDIDHITPISSAASQQEILKLNHYTNLQPLCSYTNRYIKKDNLIYENL